MNNKRKTSSKKILLGMTISILLVLICVVPTSAESFGTQAKIDEDFSEGGHLETDFGVNFMAFQPDGAEIQYDGDVEGGSAFYEYLVTDMGVITPTVKIFEMPELDIQKTYTYNTTFDLFVPDRIGEEAVLYWGEKAEIAGEEYYVSNLSKLGGGEVQYLGLDVGKTWEREEVTFSGMVWIGYPAYVTGTTWGSAVVTDEEDIVVPAGIAHCLIIETTMNSSMIMQGKEMRMNTSQKIWLMEKGFFANS